MAEKKLIIEIITPQRVVYKGDAESVNLPGSLKPFQVLYNHAPIVSSLDAGLVTVSADRTLYFAVASGFAEVNNNKISILVESAQEASEIDKIKLAADIKLAIDALANAKGDDEKATAKLQLDTLKAWQKASEKK